MVSVIIPAYQADRFILSALNSIIKQTYRPMEVVIINDGSTDDTENMVHQFCSNNHITKSVKTIGLADEFLVNAWSASDETSAFSLIYAAQVNAGPSSARNTGIRLATGEFVSFLDADDLWMSDKIANQIQFLNTEKIDCVFSDVAIEKNNGEKIQSIFQNYKWEIPAICNDDYFWIKKLLDWNFIITSTLLVKRECFEKIDLFDEKIKHGEDYDLCLRLSLFFKFGFLSSVTCTRKIHASNLSLNEVRFFENKIYILKKIQDEYSEMLKSAQIDLNKYIEESIKNFSYYYYTKKKYRPAVIKLTEYAIFKLTCQLKSMNLSIKGLKKYG